MIIIYLAILATALYFVVKTLGPEMMKPVTPSVRKTVIKPAANKSIPQDAPENGLERLETLIAEKNRNIILLQNELKIAFAQIRDFDKVKTLLEEEIHSLREQNRILRSELGIPALSTPVEQK